MSEFFTIVRAPFGNILAVVSAGRLARVFLGPHALRSARAPFPNLSRNDRACSRARKALNLALLPPSARASGTRPAFLTPLDGGPGGPVRSPGFLSASARNALLLLCDRDITPFALAVRHALLRIPFGRVATYGDIAAAIGRPGAARAVGNALHRNPFPILVPCHRVVRSDLSLGGFASGPSLKRAILASEGVTFTNGKVDPAFQVPPAKISAPLRSSEAFSSQSRSRGAKTADGRR
ncbi:MAG: MGMT family protein [Planctomycetota bacterium]